MGILNLACRHQAETQHLEIVIKIPIIMSANKTAIKTLGTTLTRVLPSIPVLERFQSTTQRLYKDYSEAKTLPETHINLLINDAAGNSPFYRDVTQAFYDDARRRHHRLPLIRQLEWGVALCEFPATFDEYFMMVEGAARRNFKKATRLGYTFKPINYNDYLKEIQEIRRSTTVRQGKLPEEFLNEEVKPTKNPPTQDTTHCYPTFGVFDSNNELRAYLNCLIAGELCMIEHIYGHAKYQSDGGVPLLIISAAKYILEHHPKVKFYSYGSFYGASVTMRRFKRKFHLLPHHVIWHLDRLER